MPLPARHGRAKSGPGFSTTWKAPKRPCSSEVGVPGPGGAQPPEGRLSVPFRAKTRPRSPSRGDWSGDRANGATPIPGGFRTEARLSEEEDHSCHQSLYISASKKHPEQQNPAFDLPSVGVTTFPTLRKSDVEAEVVVRHFRSTPPSSRYHGNTSAAGTGTVSCVGAAHFAPGWLGLEGVR